MFHGRISARSIFCIDKIWAVFHYKVFLSEKQKRLQHRPLQTIKKHKSLTNLNKNNKTEPEKLNVLNTEEQKKRETFVT